MLGMAAISRSVLFDIYFNLGSFYLGICAGFAYSTKAQGAAHGIAIAVGTLLISLWGWAFRWHLQRHSRDNGWSSVRRIAPLVFYILGFGLPFTV